MSAMTVLNDLVGISLVRLRRVLYVHNGVVWEHTGPLQLTFQNGASIVLEAGGDGESLIISRGAWVDAFEEPMSDENRHFVEMSGKWTGFEVAPSEPLGRAVGQELTRVAEVRNPSDKLTGVVLKLGTATIRVDVDSDELLVDVA